MQSFKITIVSDSNSWINFYISELIEKIQQACHQTHWVHTSREIQSGDFVFYLGCGQIIPPEILSKNKHNLVVHESALPFGRGWSPLTWQILEGQNSIPITLFEATKEVDSGVIYLQKEMKFFGTELLSELREAQAIASIELCLEFIEKFPDILSGSRQQEGNSSYYPRRIPKDSLLDPDKTIREQFNLLRVVDNERYPAFFEIDGETYILKIEKYSRLSESGEDK